MILLIHDRSVILQKLFMRTILLVFFLFVEIISTSGQIKHASIQAAGLTCAMCSNAIYQSLSSLSFIEEVTPDVEHSSFEIRFKSDQEIHPVAMRDAVEEAGFSVAQFSMTIGFNHLQLSSDHIFKISNLTFYVMKGEGIILDQDVEFVFLDQGFMIDKRMKELESELGVVLRKKKKNYEPNKFRVMIKKDR